MKPKAIEKSWLACLLALVSACRLSAASAICYSVPDEVRSGLWEAEVNGESNGVASARTADPPFDKRHDHGGEYAFTSFEMSAPVKMTVRSKKARDMSCVRLLPASAPVSMRHMPDGAIELSIARPCKFSVEPDGRRNPLLVFANPPEQNVPDVADKNVKVYEAGIHLGGKNGRIELRDGETLYLKAGAFVKGGICVHGKNIRICGRGVVDGSDYAWRKGPTPHVVQMHGSRNVIVEDITIRGAPHWTIVPFNCDDVTIRNVKLCGGRVWNDDGINPCNSRNVLVEDCFLRTDDDCIAAKGLDPKFGNCENVTVRNCVFWCDRARIVLLGHESGAPIMRNFLFENCDVVHFQMPVFLLEPGEDMRLDNVRAKDIRINTDDPGRVYEIVSARPTVNRWMRKQVPGRGVSNCLFENLSVTGERADCRFSMEGRDADHRLENFVISNAMLYGRPVKSGDPVCRIGAFAENVTIRSDGGSTSVSSVPEK